LSRPFLPAIGTLGGAYCLLALLLALADPLALYPWGASPQLEREGDYSMEATPFLVDATAKNAGFDTLFIGGSTGHSYTPRMMEEILPDTRRAFNLSYGAPRATDRALVQRQILRYSHAHHFVLEADWSFIIPLQEQHTAPSFPLYLYDDKWWNDVRDVNLQVIKLSLAILRGKPLWIRSWSKTDEEQTFRNRYQANHTEGSIARYAAMIARRKGSVDAHSDLTCDAMDAIGAGLVPLVRTLSQRGARVDLVVPPYSWLIYYRSQEPGDPIHRPSLLSDVLLMRACIVQAVEGMPGVSVFAFEDAAIGGDFGNFMDVGHLYNPDVNRYILRSIAEGEHRLTRDNIEAKNAEMRSNVVRYQLTNGKKSGIPSQ
jgi:hypothetical protein